MNDLLYKDTGSISNRLKQLIKKSRTHRKKITYTLIVFVSIFWLISTIFSVSNNNSYESYLSNTNNSEEDKLFFKQFNSLSDKNKAKVKQYLEKENYLMNRPDEDLLVIAQSIVEEFRIKKGNVLDDEIKANEESAADDDKEQEDVETYKASFLSKTLKLLQNKEPFSYIKKNIECELPSDLSILNSKDDKLLTLENLRTCFSASDIEDKVKNSNIHQNYAYQVKNLVKDLPFDKLYNTEKCIVIPAGGDKTLAAMGLISLLRERGSKIPIEIYLPPRYTDEMDSCNLMSKIADPFKQTTCFGNSNDVLKKALLNIEKQELFIDRKDLDGIFALIGSSSKQALLVDTSYFPFENIDNLFQFDKFIETGMLLWPRSLHRLTSPVFYELVRKQPNLQKRINHGINDVNNGFFFMPDQGKTPLADLEDALPDKTIDSKIMLIDKIVQMETLLMSLYYQVFGETWYNILLELQGNEMNINHESYMAGLYVTKSPYYLLNTISDTVKLSNIETSSAKESELEIHHDPFIDNKNYESAKNEMSTWTGAELQISGGQFYERFYTQKKPLFASAKNSNTFDPIKQFKKYLLANNDQFFRYIETTEILKNIDIEFILTTTYLNLMCTNSKKIGSYSGSRFTDQEEYLQFCNYLEKRIHFLKK
ncbi:hypothetical protein QEN19_003651 [Hanseniaspora menglaensis]